MFEGIRGKAASKKVKDPIEENDEKLGAYLVKHDMPTNGSRRDRYTNKALIVLSGALATIAALEGIALDEMMPLYKVVPVFVTFSDKADQVVRIEPPSGRIPGIKILVEQQVKDYITFRNTISADTTETIDRWGSRVRLMSSEEVYANFIQETKPVYDQLRGENFTRTIAIKTVLPQEGGLYQVEFDAYDHRQGSGLTDTSDVKTTWIAQLRVDLESKKVSFDQRVLNPIGFTVREYSVARKRS